VSEPNNAIRRRHRPKRRSQWTYQISSFEIRDFWRWCGRKSRPNYS